eukprot:TRINITY_DN631_c0_g1_i2.p1 TRINITY_DN631_c0_g1~~TRINITY_DN631_c0_g1_i2.p1  ORF type:complete len:313 (+),score=97.73 TRINITY_DN631_c0_g1_i2:148-1086(+)
MSNLALRPFFNFQQRKGKKIPTFQPSFSKRWFSEAPPAEPVHLPFHLVILGPPGSGKTTLAQHITSIESVNPKINHVKISDLLKREAKEAKSPLQKFVAHTLAKNELVPDEVVAEVLKRELMEFKFKQEGWVLEVFPMTSSQAVHLSEVVNQLGERVHSFFLLKSSPLQLLDRLRYREVHKASGRVYHPKYNPPKVEGKDDQTGEPLVRSENDQPKQIQERMKRYVQESGQLMEWLSEQEEKERVVVAEVETESLQRAKRQMEMEMEQLQLHVGMLGEKAEDGPKSYLDIFKTDAEGEGDAEGDADEAEDKI